MVMSSSDIRVWHVISFLSLCFFTIAFMAFLSVTQPFVLTDILKLTTDMGAKVGVLGFADECLTLVLCPLWGALSDKIGTRYIASLGILLIGIALSIYTSGKNVYPDLLLRRLVFASGASACISMIPAIISELSDAHLSKLWKRAEFDSLLEDTEVTSLPSNEKNGKLVGFIGIFTGLGALCAVTVFVPLPAFLAKYGIEYAQSLKLSYYALGGMGMVMSIVFFFGLHQDPSKDLEIWLKGEREPLLNDDNESPERLTYFGLLEHGYSVALTDSKVRVSYIGAFVARSSAVVTALFLPLLVNGYYLNHGCKNVDKQENPSERCSEAYIVTAILSGILHTVSLILAPAWGILADRVGKATCIVISCIFGVVGSFGFGALMTDPRSLLSIIMSGLLGVGQIGIIINSLSLCTETKRAYSGAIAGVYSFCGGVGILSITYAGGRLADWKTGSPFLVLSVYYLILLICCVCSPNLDFDKAKWVFCKRTLEH